MGEFAATPDVLLEEKVGLILTRLGLTLVTAESCTGGLVAHRLTNVPGSSNYVLGGIVAYSNAAKEQFLGVSPVTLEAHGAVSEPTALEMARGVLRAFDADLALATTGIAGPTGATPQKPIGLTYVALAGRAGESVERFVFPGDRLENKERAAEMALALLLRHLLVLRPDFPPGETPSLNSLGATWDGIGSPKQGAGMDTLVTVEARMSDTGDVSVRSFTWQGREWAVTSSGRQWTEPVGAGQRRCVLVMAAGLGAFQLCLEPDGLWRGHPLSPPTRLA
jgi:nicotinamide-nucleotide amidase